MHMVTYIATVVMAASPIFALHCVPIVESTTSHVRYKLWVADMLMCVADACLRRDQRNAFDTHCTPPGDHQRNDRTIDVVSLMKM
jgi:hypothetical protein